MDKIIIGEGVLNILVSRVVDICQNTKSDTINIAVSAGATMSCFLPVLFKDSRFVVLAKKVLLWITDERIVDHSHSESNSRLIRSLVSDSNLILKGIVPTQFPKKEKDDALLISRPPFDCVLIGIGLDGHIASLFDHYELISEDPDYLHLSNRTHKFDRVTMTASRLSFSAELIIIAIGQEKIKVALEAIKSRATSAIGKFSAINKLNAISWYLEKGCNT